MLNAKPAEPSSQIKLRDRIALELTEKTIEIELIEIPSRQVSKKEALGYYRLLMEKDRKSAGSDAW